VDYAPDALLPYLARVRDTYQDRALHAGRVLLHLRCVYVLARRL
jgi:hypothetical protein